MGTRHVVAVIGRPTAGTQLRIPGQIRRDGRRVILPPLQGNPSVHFLRIPANDVVSALLVNVRVFDEGSEINRGVHCGLGQELRRDGRADNRVQSRHIGGHAVIHQRFGIQSLQHLLVFRRFGQPADFVGQLFGCFQRITQPGKATRTFDCCIHIRRGGFGLFAQFGDGRSRQHGISCGNGFVQSSLGSCGKDIFSAFRISLEAVGRSDGTRKSTCRATCHVGRVDQRGHFRAGSLVTAAGVPDVCRLKFSSRSGRAQFPEQGRQTLQTVHQIRISVLRRSLAIISQAEAVEHGPVVGDVHALAHTDPQRAVHHDGRHRVAAEAPVGKRLGRVLGVARHPVAVIHAQLQRHFIDTRIKHGVQGLRLVAAVEPRASQLVTSGLQSRQFLIDIKTVGVGRLGTIKRIAPAGGQQAYRPTRMGFHPLRRLHALEARAHDVERGIHAVFRRSGIQGGHTLLLGHQNPFGGIGVAAVVQIYQRAALSAPIKSLSIQRDGKLAHLVIGIRVGKGVFGRIPVVHIAIGAQAAVAAFPAVHEFVLPVGHGHRKFQSGLPQ